MRIRVVNKSGQALPAYETSHAAGMDLRACVDQPVLLAPMQRTLIPTGLFIELPQGYEAQIRPRSGLALKHGITVLNSPGTMALGTRSTAERPSRAQAAPKVCVSGE